MLGADSACAPTFSLNCLLDVTRGSWACVSADDLKRTFVRCWRLEVVEVVGGELLGELEVISMVSTSGADALEDRGSVGCQVDRLRDDPGGGQQLAVVRRIWRDQKEKSSTTSLPSRTRSSRRARNSASISSRITWGRGTVEIPRCHMTMSKESRTIP